MALKYLNTILGLTLISSFDFVSPVSTSKNATEDCLRNVKCPMTEAPICVRVQSVHQKPLYIMALNQCEIDYLKCYPSVNATVVSMKACHYENETESSRNDNAQKRIKRSARKSIGNEHEIGIIQFSSVREKADDLKQLTEWSASSLEEFENKVFFGFVVDVSKSMEDVLPLIKNAIKDVLDMVSDDSSKRITDLVLTVYVWPQINGSIMSRTQNSGEFMLAVNDLHFLIRENDRCQQDIHQASIQALERAAHNTHMYVFTNGPPSKDDAHFEIEVRRLAEEKQVEVNFVVTGDCDEPEGEEFQSFYPVAAEAKGQVLRIDKEHLEKEFLVYVNHTVMEVERRVVVSSVYPAQGSNKLRIPFEVTKKDDFAVVTVSGDNCDCVVYNNRNNTMDYAYNVTTEHVKMYKYIALHPGEYRIRVYPNGKVSGQHKDLSAPVLVSVAISSVELLFKYGFSEETASTLKNTEPQPERGSAVYIIIAVREPKYLVIIKNVSILTKDDEVISTYSLVKTAVEDVYRTKHQIVVPKRKMMKIKITGIIRDTLMREKIERISTRIFRPYKKTTSEDTTKTTMTPITTTSTGTTPARIPPKIDKKLENQQCETVNPTIVDRIYFVCIMKCPVIEGEPDPEIKWTVTPDASVDVTDDNKKTSLYGEILVWVMRRNHEGIFEDRDFLCRATNEYGEDKYSFKMRYVEDDEGYVPEELNKLSVTEGDDVEIKCRLKRFREIKWAFKRKHGRGSKRYRPLEKTGKTLFLNSVTKEQAGFYKCMPAMPDRTEEQIIELEILVPGGLVYYDYVFKGAHMKKLKAELPQYSSCPSQCPARDVLVCARCQHNVHRTFLSACYMHMYQCKHPEDRLELVARRPCTASAAFLGDMPRPIMHVA